MPPRRQPDSFGRRLILARQRRDLTTSQLARLADMDETTISHYECDRRKPGADNIRQIAKALDMSADYLLDLSNDTRRINEIAEAAR
jgi:transcriptional regulator with XRE-family HTH domain